MTADPMPTIIDTLAGEAALRTVPKLDPHTLTVAEQTIRDMIPRTSFASSAALLRRAADKIHELGERS